MRAIVRLFFALGFAVILVSPTYAASGTLVLKTDFKIWEINLGNMDWFSSYEKDYFLGLEVDAQQDEVTLIEPYLNTQSVEGVDSIKLKDYLKAKIAPDIDRPKEDVTIDMDENGNVVFDGSGLYGRTLDLDRAVRIISFAIDHQIGFVSLPIVREEPTVTVLSDELKKMGIKELVSGGETNYARSPVNRINNIEVGLSKFNGHIIKQGEEFVFGNVLGTVDGTTGYKRELVILGDRTVPEYGGGLCQVSTTSYRAALAAGFPVTMRKNHSYAVSYYTPYGLDATVYPPSVDFKFINDSPGAILIQTFTDYPKAYYNYYGTKDDRDVYMIGPYYSDRTPPPPPRREYTTKLPPGEEQVLGHAVPGLNASWFRQVVYNEGEKKDTSFLDHIFSHYQARPDFVMVGAKEGQILESDAISDDGYQD